MYLSASEEQYLLDDLLQDDCTSCTSSLATTVSMAEDMDDLHLGAEANSFVGLTKKDYFRPISPDNSENQRKFSYNGFLVAMKEIYSSYDSSISSRTYISSVNDLLKAREGDIGDILNGLGFANNKVERERREILCRFEASPLLTEEDNKRIDMVTRRRGSKASTVSSVYMPVLQQNEITESISKAEDWLTHHHEASIEATKPDVNKVITGATEITRRPSFSKALKARRKFSKSRQSSFDLLPKLKEVDSSQEKSPNCDNVKAFEDALCSAIREKASNCDEMHEPDVRENFPPSVKRSCSTEDDGLTNEQLTHHPPSEPNCTAIVCQKAEKPAFLSTRTESFELEEINSVSGEALDCKRFSVVSSSTTVDYSSSSPEIDGSFSANRPRNAHGDESDSSSGFDDDYALSGFRTHGAIRLNELNKGASSCNKNSNQLQNCDAKQPLSSNFRPAVS